MSAPLLIIVAVIYGVVALDRTLRGDDGFALFALGCAIANCGLAWKAVA